MSFKFRCGSCDAVLRIGPRYAGQRVRCGECDAILKVPTEASGQAKKPASSFSVHDALEGGFALRPRAKKEDDFDLTPMVDVTFLLLIFFMITASFSVQKTLEVPPPDPEDKGASQAIPLEDLQDDSVIVRIEAGDRVFVDDEPINSIDDLSVRLSELMREDRKTEMVIQATDQARHEAVVIAYDAGNEVGMQRIRIANPDS
ncbi:ExbD/TolR family protein [Stratiformator vulcanicus]|uniref:Biopolymer transport protein ExbD n=1 Tax=Stratiformator vulcanicus TaxID=2527980 RepID=A0A517R1M2_9PLAN|nr:biopolymer transporter ExbD [Stratiformator vulcanicus]QDT37772.1 biopolymer transport protein ExbD [Stratiformator vulcanicus]